MTKRLLSSLPSEIVNYNKEELLESIQFSEGRTVVSEIVCENALLDDLSNPELAAAFGADIIFLNLFDLENPAVKNLKGDNAEEIVKRIKDYTGCPLAINLEPVVEADKQSVNKISKGRQASLTNIEKAVKAGFDIICFTGNPSVGVSNDSLVEAVKKAHDNFGKDVIIAAGKMHMAGINDKYTDINYIENLINSGADIILLPAPGTVPGIDLNSLRKIEETIHQNNKLLLTAIGTSQEGSDPQTIRDIALQSKKLGADLQHIGDAGYGGIAIPENILTLSKVIRGKRHTYKKMAISVKR